MAEDRQMNRENPRFMRHAMRNYSPMMKSRNCSALKTRIAADCLPVIPADAKSSNPESRSCSFADSG